MKKTLLLLGLCLGCSQAAQEPTPGSGAGSQRFPSLRPASGFPVIIEHRDGRESRLENSPRAVLPSNAGLVDDLFLLLEPGRVAALPKGSFEYSRLRDLPQSPWSMRPIFPRFAAEEVLSQGPDLVLTNDWQNPESLQILEQNGVPVLSLPTPASWDEVLTTLRLLGRVTDTEERAQRALEDLEARRQVLLETQHSGRGLRVLAYSNFGGGGFTSGQGSTMDMLLSLAGYRNAASEAGLKGECSLNFEQLLTIDPDLLLVSRAEDGSSPSALVLTQRAELAGLAALRSERLVYLHKALFSSTSSQLIEAAESLQREVRLLLEE